MGRFGKHFLELCTLGNMTLYVALTLGQVAANGKQTKKPHGHDMFTNTRQPERNPT